jgi:acetoin utilization deacetylase AcuC-like enzyme
MELPIDWKHSTQWLADIHGNSVIETLDAAKGSSGWIDADTYYTRKSVDTAWLAVGACRELALDIWNGRHRRGFAICRPPGHHATLRRSMGFCLLNNIAIAAKAILTESPQARIAIVDYDLHHGNGTQEAFYLNPNVLFVSSHRFPFYPGTGHFTEVGESTAKGTTINLPLPKAYDDRFFFSLYETIVLPVLREFRPEMILISAGFDGHEADPMQGFSLTTQGYRTLSERLVSVAEEVSDGKILFVLEGGYNPAALTQSIDSVVGALQELPRQAFAIPPSGQNDPVIDRLQRYFAPYFPSV